MEDEMDRLRGLGGRTAVPAHGQRGVAVPHGRSSRVRLAAAVAVAAVVATGLVVPAVPAAAVGGAVPALVAPGVTRAVVIDPTTGQRVISVASLSLSGISGTAATNTVGQTNREPDRRVTYCRTLLVTYIIYFEIPYLELLTWNFSHKWCWREATIRPPTMVSAVASNARTYKSITIKQVGSFQKTQETLGLGVGERITHQGMHFEYCPLGNHLCFGNFDPIISVELLAGGGVRDISVT
jgi:hypothetical protein